MGQAVRREVAAEALRTSGKLRLRVFGGSMLPSIWPGDVLLIRRATPVDLELGDLVLYATRESFIVHRIVSKDVDHLTTRGDSLRGNDEPVPFTQVLGKVAMIEHGREQFVPQKPQGLERLLSLLLRRCAPIKALALRVNSLRLKLDRTRSNGEAALA